MPKKKHIIRVLSNDKYKAYLQKHRDAGSTDGNFHETKKFHVTVYPESLRHIAENARKNNRKSK